ncbi:MAG: hypothetical protein M1837_001771 [Sclerophora amabilis]|nr:MAG: hypothetical protein M1837_001771 [Sclerophora amabilis]
MLTTRTASPSFPLLPSTSTSSLTKATLRPFTGSTTHQIRDPRAGTFPSDTSSAPRAVTNVRNATSPSSEAPSTMNGYPGATSPPGMCVRALYDYEADDRTSLSFRQGDVIQVITQLESGWWDGIINGVRGWFPSNYCALVTASDDDGTQATHPGGLDEGDVETDEDDDFRDDYEDDDVDSDGNPQGTSPDLPLEGTDSREQEEAAFWIPQATPDGRLFYFNTLTGISTMELPLETPTSATETGPRDRMNVNVPEQTRPPPEMMARGYERDEDETDYEEGNSERDGESLMLASGTSLALRKKTSHTSNGLSPATSMDSIGGRSSSKPGSGNHHGEIYNANLSMSQVNMAVAMPAMGTTTTSFTGNAFGQAPAAALPRSFFDDGIAVPLTWNRLVENMRAAVERYRQSINNSDRSEYVSRAEDISDHLRLLLAAGSGTTDNHSGQPSIISTNRALYPHFRDMMSKLSKLVLSSHIAAADWPTPDSYAKCLNEAEGVLHGVFGYVEVARTQRGEDIPRLVPGFVVGSTSGGNWQTNGLASRDPTSSSFMDQDENESQVEPTTPLDTKLLEKLEDLKRMISSSIRRLDEQLRISDKMITRQRHEMIANAVCLAGGKVVEFFRPWISTVESINLGALGSDIQTSQLGELSLQKQRVYDLISDLILDCQSVAAPLADEWAEIRGDSLEDRLQLVRSTAAQLDACISQLFFSLQYLDQMMPRPERRPSTLEEVQDRREHREHRKTDGSQYERPHQRSQSRQQLQRPQLADFGQSASYTEGVDRVPENYRKGDSSKVKKFFGEVPTTAIRTRELDEIPSFLKLDLEGEIAYDPKVDPPQIRGGTLAALVEQLTRHDKLDSPFNTTFLLTYRSFTTAAELFEMLVNRFSIQPPYGMDPEDYQTWVDRKQKIIRFRVVNILKSWFDNYWMEGQDAASKELIRRVYSFAEQSLATGNTPGAQPLMAVLEQRLRGQDANAKRLVVTSNSSVPAPIMPRNMKRLKFLDIDVTEFARQLTIIESRLYGKIKPTECLNKTWQRKVLPDDGSEVAVNVKALILHSNQLTNWVAEMILTQNDLKKRVVVIKHFVSVAEKCRALNNFSTLTSIISALGTAPVHRLKRTWDQVQPRTMALLEKMRALMGSTKNFGEYRESLHLANPPCIPFFGVYLTDLTFIEDGIQDTIKKTNLINFAKRAKTAEVIRDIQQYQNVPYSLQPVPELQEYILSNMQSAGDVHEMYDRSLQVEPREREVDQIQRYGRQYAPTLTLAATGG